MVSQPVDVDKESSSPEPPDEVAPLTEEMEADAPVEATQRAPLSEGLDAESTPEVVSAPDLVRPWREELSQRVENFRRRRAHLRQGPESDPNLGFDFQATGEEETEPVPIRPGQAVQDTHELDVTLRTPESGEMEAPILDALPLEAGPDHSILDHDIGAGIEPDSPASRAFEESQLPLGQARVEPAPPEIVLESLPPMARPGGSLAGSLVMPQASLGRRFLAGLVDTLVLLLAVVLFGLVFQRVGGHITIRPLNILVLGCIAALFILVYFGVFTALTSSTPGLLWMGLEVRNLDGEHANPRQAAWRAFGYLVSVAGLMLGFIWALVDTESLTWHDRISGTFLTVAQRESQ
jgi:uncharacterized RDD family membrane protein YckC